MCSAASARAARRNCHETLHLRLLQSPTRSTEETERCSGERMKGRLPCSCRRRHLPVDVDVPLVIDAETTVWRGSLLLLAIVPASSVSPERHQHRWLDARRALASRAQARGRRRFAQRGASPGPAGRGYRRGSGATGALRLSRRARGRRIAAGGCARHPAIAEVIVAEVCETGTAKATPVDLCRPISAGLRSGHRWHGVRRCAASADRPDLQWPRQCPGLGVGKVARGRHRGAARSFSRARAGAQPAIAPVRQEPDRIRSHRPRRPPHRYFRGHQHARSLRRLELHRAREPI